MDAPIEAMRAYYLQRAADHPRVDHKPERQIEYTHDWVLTYELS